MTKTQARSSAYAWYVLLILFLVNAVNSIDRAMVNILVESIRREFGFSDGQIGILSGLGFALFYAMLGVPIARLADRSNRRNILAIGLTAWSVLTALTGRATGFFTFLLARAGVGIGEASCYPTAYPLIADYFPKQRRPMAMAIFQMGLFLGIVAGNIVAGKIAAAHGWRAAFAVIGLPGVLLATILFLTVREPIRGANDDRVATAPAPRRFGEAVALITGNRCFMLVVLGTTLLTMAQATLGAWGPSFLMRLHGITQGDVGVISAPIGLAGAVGTLGGGAAGSWLSQRSGADRAPLRVPLAITLIAAPGVLLYVFSPSVPLLIIGGGLGAFGIGVHSGPALAVAMGLVRAEMRGLAASVIIIGHLLLGYGLGPLIAGIVSDGLRPSFGEQSLRYAMILVPLLIGLGWLAIAAAYRMIGRQPVRADAAA